MCDESTEAENEAYAERVRLSRRELGMGAGAALAAVVTGCASTHAPVQEPDSIPAPANAEKAAPPETTGRAVTIDTPDGTAEAFFVTPKSGKHPGVLMWPDVAGLRDAYRTTATRLASEGYAVLAVNQYYRSAKLPLLTTFSEWRTEEGKKKIAPMREAITPEGIARDGAAFAAWLDQQKEVDAARKLATCGYCMGGPFTFRTAAAVPKRVGVVASFHGGGLVTDEPASPYALLPQIKAAALICIAQNDDEREPEVKTKLRQAAEGAHVPAEIEVYPAQHGFCTVDSPVYDRRQAERAWARMLATFERYL
ncbi:MAG TPA: dienelactone hydrolase family protein [Polyangiaceae bacterium]|nr:dienelactone hydrolase family protein [Polyangiaceae bacterium]